jgi:spore coat protein H
MKGSVKIWKSILAGMAILIVTSGCYREEDIPVDDTTEEEFRILGINGAEGFVDAVERIVMFTLGRDTVESFAPTIQFNNYSSIQFEGRELITGQVNELGKVMVNHPYSIVTGNDNRTDSFQLIFTSLPLMQIHTDEQIPDEPKILSRISLQGYDERNPDKVITSFNTFAGIEIRGRTSMAHDKKSYGIELWKNMDREDYSYAIFGMRPCEDWILDAMYIDNLRMRNKISFELWEKISNTPEQDMKPDVFPGIHCRHVELFLNNRYQGIYCLGEKMDERLLHFARDQDEQGGVLYKAISWADGSTTFDRYLSDPPDDYIWEGWELIYPADFAGWDALDEFWRFVVFSGDGEFEDGIGSFFYLENAVHYYLFLNLTKALDNKGKNTYLARYTNQSPFFIIPWDMEASWGISWEGLRYDPENTVSNHLFDRLIGTDADDFKEKLKTEWSELRKGDLSEKSLLEPITEYYTLLKVSGAIDRENTRWDDANIDLDTEYDYINGWIRSRLEVLDEHFK